MELSTSVLGSSVVRHLRNLHTTPVLRIGADRFNRHDLAAIGCFNFTAAANLSALLTHELHVKDTRDVFEHIAPNDLAIPGLGAISLSVLGAAFEAKGLGGAHPLAAWVEKHRPDGIVTFTTMKHARRRVDEEHTAQRREKRATREARTYHRHRRASTPSGRSLAV